MKIVITRGPLPRPKRQKSPAALVGGWQHRAAGFRQLYRWLGDRHFGLVVMADREEPLLILRFGEFLRQCAFRERAREGGPKTPTAVSGGFEDVSGMEVPYPVADPPSVGSTSGGKREGRAPSES